MEWTTGLPGLGDGVDVFSSSYINESIGISVGGVVLDGGWVFTLALAAAVFACSRLGDGVDVFGSSYFNESIGISVGGVVLDGGWVFTLALASPMFGCSHWRNEAWKGCSCSYTG
ncbi:uncharacterized protein [Euphorbia lathyris]